MKKNRKRYRRIQTLDDLKYEKFLLKEELESKEEVIEEKARMLKNSYSSSQVITEVFDMKNGLKTDLITYVLPLFLKYRKEIAQSQIWKATKDRMKKSPNRKLTLISIAALGVGLVVRKFLKNKAKNKENNENE